MKEGNFEKDVEGEEESWALRLGVKVAYLVENLEEDDVQNFAEAEIEAETEFEVVAGRGWVEV